MAAKASTRATRKQSSPTSSDASLRTLRRTFEAIADRLHREGVLRSGALVFRVSAGASAGFSVRATDTGVQIDDLGEHADPVLEVIGDPRRLDAIVRGRKDARKQFFAGGIRVRGDMHYLSELGMKLGCLKKPIV